MKKYPLFLQPVFQERIWGGTALHDTFGYDIQGEHVGECWGISAHPHGESVVKNGVFQGKTLRELWGEQRELFGSEQVENFPLMTKILDAKMDLSVQVHPDDAYAQRWENGSNGKTECWYVIDCDEGAEIIYGHRAANKQQFAQLMAAGQWDQLWKRIPVSPGDFFYVPSGTIHALGAGTLILETQQSSDVTYRVYDYERVDTSGKKRELHQQKALDVTTFQQEDTTIEPFVTKVGASEITRYVENEFFSVQKWVICEETSFVQDQNFLMMSIIQGQGILHTNVADYALQKGDFLLLPAELGAFTLDGKIEIIVSYR